MTEVSPEERREIESKFVRNLAIAAAILAGLPALIAWQSGPIGGVYLGHQFATDDHMVYAAWMRQAMDGRFLFDNRFTTDAQPGLTIHLYFLVMGWIAKFLGIPITTLIARMGFSAGFVYLLHRLVRRMDWTIHATKLSLLFSVLGGGIGFALWHDFGVAIVKPAPDFLNQILMGRLPIDTWQPEGFVLSSMLTNGLFMVSLCLILFIFDCFLEAEQSWKPVLPGAIAFGVLMNIHSYDVLLIGMVMFGFLVMAWARDKATKAWIIRSLAISAGIIPTALWFVYVLREDPVFQARAATETFSPNFRQVLFGYFFLILLAVPTLFASRDGKKRPYFASGLYVAVLLLLAVLAQNHTDGYFIPMVVWVLLYGFTVFLLYSVANLNSARNLFVSWALVGTIAIYFPMLFQRKLGMGLVIPWAVLAAGGAAIILAKQERSARNLATALAIIIIGASGFRWVFREITLAQTNVANTIVHPVYLSADANKVITALNQISEKKVVVAPPGIPARAVDSAGQTIPDTFLTPIMPDLNPIASGLTGAYTYAGHWSETPKYNERRGELERFFYRPGLPEDKKAWLNEIGATHVIVPSPEAFPQMELPDLSSLGEVVVQGTQFSLIKVN